MRRASTLDLGGVILSVASVEDLLLLKLEAHRVEDLDDIIAFKDGFQGALDDAYLKTQADRLDLRRRLDQYFGPNP
ncbi:MAG: hypothetical protein IT384_22495 [Deltaproteobacteria bacterium]|nr:hypothetical protein [Deltaproteobacteria bacterium]